MTLDAPVRHFLPRVSFARDAARKSARAGNINVDISVARDSAHFREAWPLMAGGEGYSFHPFQALDHVETWLATIGAARKAEPLFVEIRLDNEPYLFLPLAIERRRGIRVLCFPDGGVCDYNAPVLSRLYRGPKPAQAQLWRRTLRALPPVDAVIFEKMPSHVGPETNPLFDLPGSRRTGQAYSLSLTGTWDDFANATLHRAKDSRRKRRRLREAGELRLLVGGENADREALLQAMMRLKSARYVARDGVDGFDRPGYRAYYQEMARRHTASVHLSALAVGDDILAAHWGIVSADAFYCLMLGYVSEGLGQYSPARLLLEDLIAWGFAHGLKRFDFGGGGGVWKALLGAETTALGDYEAALTPAGWTYIQARRLRQRLTRTKRPLSAIAT